MFGRGKRGADHVEFEASDRTLDTIRNLPTYNCDGAAKHVWVKRGDSGVTVCLHCGAPQ
jgi:hypothetical protein